jgi:mycofactocin precursor
MENVDPQLNPPEPVAETVAAEQPVPPATVARDADLVESELLIEEVSIDGMCGVY